MNIFKAGIAGTGGAPTAEDFECIRGFARGELAPEGLYVFPVLLCDNEVDRDEECFDAETLGELAEKFVGKTGIRDHDWRSENQVARIFRTELVREPGRRTACGEDYAGLKAWAYMLRTESNADLIADIEGGIKKEVSVGCAVRERRCSICGKSAGECVHVPGEVYGGKHCCTVLHGAADAYEWSFVAVPAQRGAGVTKAVGKGLPEGELETLKAQAALGRAYLEELRGEVKRLGLICDKALYAGIAPGIAAMDADALKTLRDTLQKRAAALLPLQTQLPAAEQTVRFDGTAYLV